MTINYKPIEQAKAWGDDILDVDAENDGDITTASEGELLENDSPTDVSTDHDSSNDTVIEATIENPPTMAGTTLNKPEVTLSVNMTHSLIHRPEDLNTAGPSKNGATLSSDLRTDSGKTDGPTRRLRERQAKNYKDVVDGLGNQSQEPVTSSPKPDTEKNAPEKGAKNNRAPKQKKQ